MEQTEKLNKQPSVSVFDFLDSLGFETQFKATEQGLLSLTTQKIYQHHEIKIVHYYRFEGDSNPSDSSIVYAIVTSNGEKGTLINGYGAFSDSQVDNFIQQVKLIHK